MSRRPKIDLLHVKSHRYSLVASLPRWSLTNTPLYHRYNPFKSKIISSKVPDGSRTTVYRCGDLIDLCRGPHLPHTGRVKAFGLTSNSATQWLGKAGNDQLQRVYGISFPDKKMLKTWEENMAKAKERDHRVIGAKQDLFMFHELSPGSAFFLPHGT